MNTITCRGLEAKICEDCIYENTIVDRKCYKNYIRKKGIKKKLYVFLEDECIIKKQYSNYYGFNWNNANVIAKIVEYTYKDEYKNDKIGYCHYFSTKKECIDFAKDKLIEEIKMKKESLDELKGLIKFLRKKLRNLSKRGI